MPVAAIDNYNTQTYPDLPTFQIDMEKCLTLGWVLVSFAFQGTSVVAVYKKQQVVAL